MAKHAGGRAPALTSSQAIALESLNLYSSYLLTRNLDDINKAVLCARRVLRTSPLSFRNPGRNLHLGRSLLRQFQNTRQAEDLTEAIESFQRALQVCEDEGNDSLYQVCLEYLAAAHAEQDGIVDARREESRTYEILDLKVHEIHGVYRYALTKVSELGRRIEDLNASIQFCRDVLPYFSSNRDMCGTLVMALGACLIERFERGNKVEDIDEAIECGRIGLELISPHSKFYWTSQCYAGGFYSTRFGVSREPEDLQNADRLIKEAVDVIELRYPHYTQDPRFAQCLFYLSLTLEGQYEATGDQKYLDAPIHAASRGVDISVGDDQQHSTCQIRLVYLLRHRYLDSSRAEDLSEASVAAQRALNCWPPNHPFRVGLLLNLFKIEAENLTVYQDRRCFDRAMDHLKEACHIHDVRSELGEEVDEEMDLQLCTLYSSLLVSLQLSTTANVDVTVDVKRFGSTATRAIDAAVDTARIGASATNSNGRLGLLELCDSLHRRWELERKIRDLDEAIAEARNLIQLADVPPASTHISILARLRVGEWLFDRFKCKRNEKDCKEALSYLVDNLRDSRVRSIMQVKAGNAAVDILIEKADWDKACKLSREVIGILVLLNGRSQAWSTKEYMLRMFDAKAAIYTMVALQAGSSVFEVVDMLETCRGSILGHFIDKQADLNELPEAARRRANHFKLLQDEISTRMGPALNTDGRMRHVDRKIKAEIEVRACLEEIRSLEGCDRFLLGPTETELKAAAAWGAIVIVNVTALRSDAVIITKKGLDSMELPELKLETVQMYIDKRLTEFSSADIRPKNRDFRKLQEWLWDTCVQPIFERLKQSGYGSTKSVEVRVWWIGIGVANSLPFHAAGTYTRKDRATALSQVISSYAPTLRALIYSQRKLKDDCTQLPLQHLTMEQKAAKIKPRLAVITMPTTPGMCDLDGVEHEASEIEKAAGGTFLVQEFPQPSAKEVMGHMMQCDVLHLACHGESDTVDPSRSCVFLQATAPNSATPAIDELNLRDLVEANLSHGKLAFLSACSTAQNRGKSLEDEVLHLVSGLQVAGYLHAIGNLWPADDSRSVELVKGFYEYLVAAGDFGNGDHVAEALNKAVLRLATRYPKDPLSWAQFVHYGG